MSLRKGTKVWLEDRDSAWVPAEVADFKGKQAQLVAASGKKVLASPEELFPRDADEDEHGGVDDMTKLTYLNEPGVLYNLRRRYALNDIYTYTGSILIAVNPSTKLPHLYNVHMMEQYKGAPFGELSSHVFAVADASYRAMTTEGRSQSILVSGESGAGKTEMIKLIMQYLTYVRGRAASDERTVEQQVLESNPLLEAFGNARTVRNDNSSRFGKLVEIQFDANGRISGAAIRTYLLEGSRVVQITDPERNYHCFYQLCASGKDAEKYKLGHPSHFHYLNQSKTYELDGVSNAEEYMKTRTAMDIVGICHEEQEAIFRTLAGILHLGNVEFSPGKEHDSSVLKDQKSSFHMLMAANLFMCDENLLLAALSTRTIQTREGIIIKALDCNGAVSSRDALAKTVYARLFDWLVEKINRSVGQDLNSQMQIGVLDIYGFECFKDNSFEEFCINFANEKLRQHFNEHVFKMEQDEYSKEEIDWSYIEFIDNQDVPDLIEKKPLGIIALLDEACMFPKSTHHTFSTRLFQSFRDHPRWEKAKFSETDFTLSHYAGKVADHTHLFLDKNRDYVVVDHCNLLSSSKCPFVADLFCSFPEESSRSSYKFSSVATRFKLGRTKVFLRAGQIGVLDSRRAEVLGNAAKRIQCQWRTFVARRNFVSTRAAAFALQTFCRGFLARAPYAVKRETAAATIAQKHARRRLLKQPFQPTGIILLMLFLFVASVAQPEQPYLMRINCGARESVITPPDETVWHLDFGFTGGIVRNASVFGLTGPPFDTVRIFTVSPECYHVSHVPPGRFTVKTHFEGLKSKSDNPEPLVDISVEGTVFASLKSSSMDGEYQVPEAQVLLREGPLTICFHRTGHVDPAILALEILQINHRAYHLTGFSSGRMVLRTISRRAFGDGRPAYFDKHPWGGYRVWTPVATSGQRIITSNRSIMKVLKPPNFYPAEIYSTAVLGYSDQHNLEYTMDVDGNRNYTLLMHFAELDPTMSVGERVFDILINGVPRVLKVDILKFSGDYYTALVLKTVVGVIGSNLTITLRPTKGNPALICALEIFEIITAEFKTVPDEVNALKILKHGLEFSRLFGWNGDPCVPQQHRWVGINCRYDRNMSKWVVEELSLNNQGLKGFLSNDISGLRHLKSINLSGNNIHGGIPSSLGEIPSLELLDLSYNSFNGSIPETLAQLTMLRRLCLNSNLLSGRVPAALVGRLQHGLKFNFNNNHGLSGVPPMQRRHPAGEVIAITFGVLAAVLLSGAAVFYYKKKKKNNIWQPLVLDGAEGPGEVMDEDDLLLKRKREEDVVGGPSKKARTRKTSQVPRRRPLPRTCKNRATL